MIETREYRRTDIDKTRWAPGPWHDEYDKKQWTDAATGLPCLVVRVPKAGHLCGYVGVPPSHPAYGKDYDDACLYGVEVHGGFTFADRCQPVADESQGVCHVAPDGEDDVWWLGFDHTHSGDLSPGWAAHCGRDGGVYWTTRAVERGCAKAAAQLAALARKED